MLLNRLQNVVACSCAYLQLAPAVSQYCLPLQYPASPWVAKCGVGQTPWLLPFFHAEAAGRWLDLTHVAFWVI